MDSSRKRQKTGCRQIGLDEEEYPGDEDAEILTESDQDGQDWR